MDSCRVHSETCQPVPVGTTTPKHIVRYKSHLIALAPPAKHASMGPDNQHKSKSCKGETRLSRVNPLMESAMRSRHRAALAHQAKAPHCPVTTQTNVQVYKSQTSSIESHTYAADDEKADAALDQAPLPETKVAQRPDDGGQKTGTTRILGSAPVAGSRDDSRSVSQSRGGKGGGSDGGSEPWPGRTARGQQAGARPGPSGAGPDTQLKRHDADNACDCYRHERAARSTQFLAGRECGFVWGDLSGI